MKMRGRPQLRCAHDLGAARVSRARKCLGRGILANENNYWNFYCSVYFSGCIKQYANLKFVVKRPQHNNLRAWTVPSLVGVPEISLPFVRHIHESFSNIVKLLRFAKLLVTPLVFIGRYHKIGQH